jgi:hypothetical protein
MNHNTLTAQYLDEISRHQVTAAETIALVRQRPLLEAYRRGRFLPRPVFLGQQERDQAHADVENIRATLVSLPDRLFGGDLAAFARAVGATPGQLGAVLRSRGTSATGLARADLYLDSTGFKLLEMNPGSAVAGIENADFCRALLAHPVISRFAAGHGLGFTDTMRALVESIFAETGLAPGSRPVVAIASEPDFHQVYSPYLREVVPRWGELGLDTVGCDVVKLRAERGGLWLDDRRVDVVFRMFVLESLPEVPVDPVLDAAARGEVAVYTSLGEDVFSSKVALAMLSDDGNRPLFSEAELASIDRILPWTRLVRPGPVTLEDGSTAELIDYAVAHAADLVLKPALQYGGTGIVPGWQLGLSEREWRDKLTAACGRPYVLQRRVRPVPELMPGQAGELEPWIVTWGLFTIAGKHGGIYIRGEPLRSGHDVINFAAGASIGSGLTVQGSYADSETSLRIGGPSGRPADRLR